MPFWIFILWLLFFRIKRQCKNQTFAWTHRTQQCPKKHQQTVLEGTHLCLTWLQQQKKSFPLFTTEQALDHPDFAKDN